MKKPRWRAAVTRAICQMAMARMAKAIDEEIEKAIDSQFFATKTYFDEESQKLTRKYYDYRAVYIDPMCV